MREGASHVYREQARLAEDVGLSISDGEGLVIKSFAIGVGRVVALVEDNLEPQAAASGRHDLEHVRRCTAAS